MEDTIAVTTDDPVEEILAAQNSAAWSINARHWSGRVRYLLCARKVGGGRRAFLLCRNLRFLMDENATRRSKSARTKYAIGFDEYVEVDLPVRWRATQNPVRVDALTNLIDAAAAESAVTRLTPVGPKAPNSPPYSYSWKYHDAAATGMSIAEAKRALAARFGVPIDAIRITIEA